MLSAWPSLVSVFLEGACCCWNLTWAPEKVSFWTKQVGRSSWHCVFFKKSRNLFCVFFWGVWFAQMVLYIRVVLFLIRKYCIPLICILCGASSFLPALSPKWNIWWSEEATSYFQDLSQSLSSVIYDFSLFEGHTNSGKPLTWTLVDILVREGRIGPWLEPLLWSSTWWYSWDESRSSSSSWHPFRRACSSKPIKSWLH